MNKCFLAALCCTFSFSTFADTRPCEGAPGAFRQNPDESQGGFVATTASVDILATLSPDAQVCNFAILQGAVKVMDQAIISGRANLSGNIAVSGDAHVFGDANLVNSDVGADMLIMEDAKVYGNAYLNGTVTISDTSEIYGNARLLDFVEVHGNSRVCAATVLSGYQVITDDTTFCTNK